MLTFKRMHLVEATHKRGIKAICQRTNNIHNIQQLCITFMLN